MINQYMTLLVEELAGDGIPDPLAEVFTLAAVWDDLARLAGERPPAGVRRLNAGAVARASGDPAAAFPAHQGGARDVPHVRASAGRA